MQSAPLQLSESRWNHDIWGVCSLNWWDAPKTATPAASIGQQKAFSFSPRQPLTTCSTTSASKVERIGLQSFAISAIFTWPLVIGLPLQAFWQLFAGKTLPQSAGGRKCFPRVPQILRRGFLFYRNKQIYFSLAIMFIVMIPILINQDVSEPSYNDLKFMVRNLYFCTNLK